MTAAAPGIVWDGILHKRGPTKKWNKRHCVLFEGALCIFEQKTMRGTIPTHFIRTFSAALRVHCCRAHLRVACRES